MDAIYEMSDFMTRPQVVRYRRPGEMGTEETSSEDARLVPCWVDSMVPLK